MSVFSLYKDILPSTGVDIAVTAAFTSPNAVNLILAKGSSLEIYKVVSEPASDPIIYRNGKDDGCSRNGDDGNDAVNGVATALDLQENGTTANELPNPKPIPLPQKTSRPRNAGRLELHSQHKLHGVITSMGVIRTTSPAGLMGMDSLLLSFKNAKMSLVEYSMSRHTITTVSIHYFEKEEFKQGPILDLPDPEIRLDPQFRCAIMLFYGEKLAILPFKTDLSGANEPDLDTVGHKNPFLPSFVIPVSSIDPQVRNVVDMAFLYDYFEPTLAILFEPVQTWTGRLAARRDTKRLIVVSLDLSRNQYPVLYRSDHLPYNCDKITAVPSPVGGVLISSPNALIHVDQSSTPGIALAVNGYYGVESEFPQPPSIELAGPQTWILDNLLYQSANVSNFKKMGISLEASHTHFLNPDTLLLILRDGDLLLVQMLGDEDSGVGWGRKRGGVRKFNLVDLNIRVTRPRCVSRVGGRGNSNGKLARVLGCLGNGLGGVFEAPSGGLVHYGHVFVGSFTGDSMLIQIWESDDHDLKNDDTMSDEYSNDGDVKMQGSTTSAIPQKRTIDTDAFDEEDEDLYGEKGSPPIASNGIANDRTKLNSSAPVNRLNNLSGLSAIQSLSTRFHFRLCDILPSISPIRDMAVGIPSSSHSNYTYEPTYPRLDLEIVACIGEASTGALGIFYQNLRPDIVTSYDSFEGINEVWTAKCESMSKRLTESNNQSSKGGNHDDEYHKYMVLSRDGSTIVLETSPELRELGDSGFFTDGPTVVAGTLLNDSVVLQVHPNGVNVLDSHANLLQSLPIGDDDSWIVSAHIVDPYLLLLMNTNQISLLKMDEIHRQLSIHKDLKDIPIVTASLYCDYHAIPCLPTQREVMTHTTRFGLNPRKQEDASSILKKFTVKIRQPKTRHKIVKQVVEKTCAKVMDVDEDDDLYGSPTTVSTKKYVEVEEEDDDLYAANDDMDVDTAAETTVTEENTAEMNAETLQDLIIEKKYFCIVFREDGALEILRLPDFEQVFYMPHFDLLPSLVSDHPNETQVLADEEVNVAQVSELLMINLGRDSSHEDVFLVIRGEDGDIAMYKAFPVLPYGDASDQALAGSRMMPPGAVTSPTSPLAQSASVSLTTNNDGMLHSHRLSIRLVRIPHDHLMREPRFFTDTEGDKLNPMDLPAKPPTFIKKHYLKPFSFIGSDPGLKYSGIFVAGRRPCWILAGRSDVGGAMQLLPQLELIDISKESIILEKPLRRTGKRYPRVLPMICDGEVLGMAAFHHDSIKGGFVYVTHSSSLRLARLPSHIDYEYDWPHQRVPLKRTPHKITYHSASATYVVLTSTPTPWHLVKANHAAAIAGGVGDLPDDAIDESEKAKKDAPVIEERDFGNYLPGVGLYQLELVSPVTWETVDTWSFDEYEQVLCVAAVSIDSKQTSSGKKQYLVAGTGFLRGEDNAGRGRIFVFDIIEVVPEIDNPQSNHKLKQVYVNEEKQPITAVRGVNGYLVAAIGTKVIIHTFEDGEELEGVAFIDTNIFVTSISTVKSLILVGDAYKSVWFLGFQEEPPKLLLLGKDYGALQVYACDFLMDNQNLAFVVSDSDQNLMTMAYAPFNPQSFGGQRLIRRADFHVGSNVNQMVRLRRLPRPKEQEGPAVVSNQYGLLCGNLDGGLGMLVPVPDKLFKRMYALWSKLVNGLQHAAGLNPRGFRQAHIRGPPQGAASILGGVANARSTLDGDLLWQFASLSVSQQRELAKSIGSSVERIMDDLVEVQVGMEHF
ncbi:hypothetical protein SeMB42_g03452 [Synchytrium endobioticum]|uniref:Cleavage/polyadenylation specificity factor A subunit C-terminal domain-containing protein n=1 Tax=Synchytrium endobioticum TaxID=286115 RepID=A0A507CN99_9FUNG|nr:hypothetical protein SeLEV6574_g06538 [Synchytrium endobioticum]TPX47104.1 hypothetical protein SeMB42_g03452 [Synchytrium endobioticum]